MQVYRLNQISQGDPPGILTWVMWCPQNVYVLWACISRGYHFIVSAAARKDKSCLWSPVVMAMIDVAALIDSRK